MKRNLKFIFSTILAAAVAAAASIADDGDPILNKFSSNSEWCDAPLFEDCVGLKELLIANGNDANISQVGHDQWVPIAKFLTCAISVFWPENLGEGFFDPTNNFTAGVVDLMLDYGISDNQNSGVIAEQVLNADQQPVLWALTQSYPSTGAWKAGFDKCHDATQNSMHKVSWSSDANPSYSQKEVNTFLNALSTTKSAKFRNRAVDASGSEITPYCHSRGDGGTTRRWRCFCANAMYNVHCEYDDVKRNGWTESLRRETILSLASKLIRQLGSLRPGATYASSPAGAMLWTGTAGNTEW